METGASMESLRQPLLASSKWEEATPSTIALSPFSSASSASFENATPGPKSPQKRTKKKGDSGLATIFNMTGALFGAGILSMPFAYNLVGWAPTMFVIITGGFLTTYTAVLLTRCLVTAAQVLPKGELDAEGCSDYPTVGYAAFGHRGRRLVNGVFISELYFILMAFLVVNGSNLQMLLPAFSKTMLISCSGTLSFLMLFCPFWVFSYFSLLGHVAMFVAILLMFYSGSQMPELPDPSDYKMLQPFPHLSQVVGLVMFCNVAHGTIPSIYKSCGQKKAFPALTRLSFLWVGGVYVMVGAGGYFLFGAATQQNFISNISKDLTGAAIRGLEALPFFASAGYIVKLQMTFPLYAMPIVQVAETGLRFTNDTPFLARALVRGAVVTAATAVAVLLQDHMANCISLTGSLFSMCTAIIFPTTFYWKLHRKKLSGANLLLLALIGCVGLYFQVTGTRDSVMKILGW